MKNARNIFIDDNDGLYVAIPIEVSPDDDDEDIPMAVEVTSTEAETTTTTNETTKKERKTDLKKKKTLPRKYKSGTKKTNPTVKLEGDLKKKKTLPRKYNKSGTKKTNPTVKLEGGWPRGWKMSFTVRKNGYRDCFYFSPKRNYRLRSLREVKYFIQGLNDQSAGKKWKGDEYFAKMFKDAMMQSNGKLTEARKLVRAKKK